MSANSVIVDLETAEVVVEQVDESELAARRSAFEAGRPERERQAHNAAIQVRLAEIDTKRSRPLSDIALGNGDLVDAHGKTPRQRLAQYEAEADALRSELL